MPKVSAGLLPVRRGPTGLSFFLAHPGGPFFQRKDRGAWTVVKGLIEAGEDALAAARREWREETGLPLPDAPLRPLGEVRQKGGKIVRAWLVEAELDPAALVSGQFEIEWPPRSGQRRSFPEIDRAAWFDAEEAREKILQAQRPFLDRAEAALG